MKRVIDMGIDKLMWPRPHPLPASRVGETAMERVRLTVASYRSGASIERVKRMARHAEHVRQDRALERELAVPEIQGFQVDECPHRKERARKELAVRR
jgi:hypothetical protein